MNTFKKTTLYTALAGIGALGMAGTANAVHVNPDGLGQVLIYPYYTTQTSGVAQPFNSLLSVVNSTASAKAVKVRFLEGKNSREVLDFNLYLSPKDVWVAGIIPAGAAAGGGAGIYTPDKSCTTPTVSADATNPTLFVNYAYSGDSGGDGLDRTREGYVEIIEMGNVTGATAVAVTHSSGVPPCTGSALADAVAQSNTVLGNGGLFGGITLINVLKGDDLTADAIALEAFRVAPAGPIWFAPGVTLPDLSLASPPQTEVFNGTTATTYTFAAGIDAVSGALMHNTLMNEYVLDTATKSGTDWVVTFPTKRFYVTGTTASQPFQRPFTSGHSCDDVLVSTWDREERTVLVVTGFSPPPPTGAGTALCYEANVVTFKGSNVLGSVNTADITSANLPSGAQNGWSLFDFTLTSGGGSVGSHRLVSTSPVATFFGLPVIGFMVETFDNGNIPSGSAVVQSSYGGNFVHKTTRLIQ